MTTKTFENAETGDKVWSPAFGWGVITDIKATGLSDYPLRVRHASCEEEQTYTHEGYFLLHTKLQSLFWGEVKIEAPTQPVRMKVIHSVEIPDISFQPKAEDRYYHPNPLVPSLYDHSYYSAGAVVDAHRAEYGLCYPDSEAGKQAAILHAKAMLGISP